MYSLNHACNAGKEDVLNRSHADIEEDISSQSETDTNSVKTKAPPPPPLDLTSVIGSEEEQKLVPSQSDVMDILSIASKGSNEVTSENLRQVHVHVCEQANALVSISNFR